MNVTAIVEGVSAAAAQTLDHLLSTPAFIRRAASQPFPPPAKWLAGNDEDVAAAFLALVLAAFVIHVAAKASGLR
jgi:hypothetical protein